MNSSPGHAAIEASELVHHYGEMKALDGLSFLVRRGTVFGLLGANGAGKSTTVDILATLLRPTSGEAFIRGHSLRRQPIEAKRRAAFVFESATPPRPHWTVREYLAFFADLRGVSYPPDSRLRALGLESLEGRLTGKLSGGQRRRVELCRALNTEAETLVLDEPTKELDLQGRRAVWDILKGEVAKGRSILLCSHDILEIQELCDEVLVLRKGRISRHVTSNELGGMDPKELERALLEAMT